MKILFLNFDLFLLDLIPDLLELEMFLLERNKLVDLLIVHSLELCSLLLLPLDLHLQL